MHISTALISDYLHIVTQHLENLACFYVRCVKRKTLVSKKNNKKNMDAELKFAKETWDLLQCFSMLAS